MEVADSRRKKRVGGCVGLMVSRIEYEVDHILTRSRIPAGWRGEHWSGRGALRRRHGSRPCSRRRRRPSRGGARGRRRPRSRRRRPGGGRQCFTDRPRSHGARRDPGSEGGRGGAGGLAAGGVLAGGHPRALHHVRRGDPAGAGRACGLRRLGAENRGLRFCAIRAPITVSRSCPGCASGSPRRCCGASSWSAGEGVALTAGWWSGGGCAARPSRRDRSSSVPRSVRSHRGDEGPDAPISL